MSIHAKHSTSNISINVPIIVNRSSSSSSSLHIYVGNILSCISPSTGITLQGNSLSYSSTIDLESSNIICDTSSCRINTKNYANNNDKIWLHPTCSGPTCNMYLGYDTSQSVIIGNNYSLTDSELDTTNTSSSGKLYLGDNNVICNTRYIINI